ncbi:retrovirus-related Pol polyprotein from transposon opus [Trichonephila clavipes]|nr:retrovirus-related Pol polyprotein from transposon opus [Trichonephila clavipes]
MAFLGRALKVDLKCLAEELGETVTDEMKVPALKKLIVASKERERNSHNEGIQEHVPVGLQKLMRTFDPKEGDISFYLILFERQARKVHINEEDWVTNLVGLLPLEWRICSPGNQKKSQIIMNIQKKFLSGKPSIYNRRRHTFGKGYRQESNNRSGYDKRNSFQKSVRCFNSGRVGHFARFCRDKKDGRAKTEGKVAEVKVSEMQVAEVKVVEDESKVVTARFNGKVVHKLVCLKAVSWKRKVDYKGHIMLQPAFGDCLKAELKEVDIGLVTNGYITPVIKTMVATVDWLNTDIFLDTETYEALLEQERIYSPRFTATMNLRSDSSKRSLEESVNTKEEEQEPTITEYDEENGNNTEKFKK